MPESRLESSTSQPGSGDQADQGLGLLDLLVILAERRNLVLGLPGIAAILALIIALILPKWYTATTKILPPQQTQSNAVALLGQLGALTGGAASQALGLKNPSDIYVAMLKSRTVADRLIERFDLKKIYDEELLLNTRKELARNTSVIGSREGVITIEVEDRDPKRAADIANAFVEELRGLTVNLAVSEAGQRRLFFEGQLKKAKNELITAEGELQKFTQDSGLVNPQGQIGLSVAAAAALRAQITAKEIQLSAMRAFATEANPDMKRSLEELGGLRKELAKMEKDTTAGKGDVMVPFGRAPAVGLEYIRRFRDVKYYETLFEVLARQYEIARIDESKDATLIQVLDAAVQPEYKTKPRRALIVLITVFIAGFLAIVIAVAQAALARARHDPVQQAKLITLRALLSRRR